MGRSKGKGKDPVKSMFILVILAASLAFIVVTGLKLVFEVPRPCEILEIWCPEGFSFPSRHTGVVFAAATVLSLYIRRVHYDVLFFVAAAAVGYWRILIAAHTFNDVVGGAAVGVVVGVLVYYILVKYRRIRSRWR